jgi:hypothetical protein
MALLDSVKAGMGFAPTVTVHDTLLASKIGAVKGFMIGAGVSETDFLTTGSEDETAVEAIVLGVTDMWNLSGGEAKFSPLFYMLVGQLASRSLEVPEE